MTIVLAMLVYKSSIVMITVFAYQYPVVMTTYTEIMTAVFVY